MTRLLRYWYQAGGLPHHRDPLQSQAQVEDVLQDSTQLGCTGFEDPRADTVGTYCLAWAESAQHLPHLLCGEGMSTLCVDVGGER